MKKLLASLSGLAFLLTAGLTLAPLSASAHVLKVDGAIGALLHTDPDDAPLVGTPTAFYLEFKDSAKTLNLQADYSLDVTVSNNAGVTDEVLPVGWKFVNPNELDFKYNFKKAGSYTLKVVGGAKAAGFDNFVVSYDLVAGAAAPVKTNDAPAFNSFGTTKATAVPAVVMASTSAASSSATSTPDFYATHTIHFVLFGIAIIIAIALIARDMYLRRKRQG